MNRTSQFMSALIFGGSIGTFVSFLLANTIGIWSLILGVAVGALSSYLAYKPKEVGSAFLHALRYILPRTFTVCRSIIDALIMPRKMQASIGTWISFTIAWLITYLYVAEYRLECALIDGRGYALTSTIIVLFASALSGALTMVMSLMVAEIPSIFFEIYDSLRNIKNRLVFDVRFRSWFCVDDVVRDLGGDWTLQKQTRFMCNALKGGAFILTLMFAVVFVLVAFVPVTIITTIKMIPALLRIIGRTFVMIHSSARTIIAVDGGLGVLITYLVARVHYGQTFLSLPLTTQCLWSVTGGLLATALGLVNGYVVAPRLGRNPLTQKS